MAARFPFPCQSDRPPFMFMRMFVLWWLLCEFFSLAVANSVHVKPTEVVAFSKHSRNLAKPFKLRSLGGWGRRHSNFTTHYFGFDCVNSVVAVVRPMGSFESAS